MKITFLGATHEVTGSMSLIEAGGRRILVDCGMEQGKDVYVNQSLPVKASEIDAVLLTHAHIDHSGNIPLLFKQGYHGPVYATEATVNLCQIMLEDCGHIQESEAEWTNRKNKRAGHEQTEPLYTVDDAKAAMQHFIPVDYGETVRIEENVTVRFGNAGHLLGAAHIEIWLTEDGITKKIVFSGDVGNTGRPIIRDPEAVGEADYVVIESTYGDRQHAPHEGEHTYIRQLADVIDRTLGRGGNLVIPAFAVGRTQEILYFIREIKEQGLVKSVPNFKVVLDSPLAVEATAIFQQTTPDYLDEDTKAVLAAGSNPVFFDEFYLSVSSEESKELNFNPEPKVLISASGMCEAGRIRHHLKHNLWRKESTILFVGYQTEGTLGRALLDGAETVKLFGEEISVQAELAVLDGISGHADRDGLLRWLEGFRNKPAAVFVNHGEDAVTDSFAQLVHERFGMETAAPYSGAVYDLAAGEWLFVAEGIPVEKKVSSVKAERYYDSLLAAAAKISALAASLKEHSNKEIKGLTKDLEKLLEKYG